jgi:hypothetical protein
VLEKFIEEIIEENPEMEQIVQARGGLSVTMDDWFDWLRDEVVGNGMTGEEEVIRSNFELNSFFVYFLIFFWFFLLISSFFSSLFCL